MSNKTTVFRLNGNYHCFDKDIEKPKVKNVSIIKQRFDFMHKHWPYYWKVEFEDGKTRYENSYGKIKGE